MQVAVGSGQQGPDLDHSCASRPILTQAMEVFHEGKKEHGRLQRSFWAREKDLGFEGG